MIREILTAALIIGGMGLLLGGGLSFFAKRFDADAGVDERLTALLELLPMVNCGACGELGCESYAKAVLEGKDVNPCPIGGTKTAENIKNYLTAL